MAMILRWPPLRTLSRLGVRIERERKGSVLFDHASSTFRAQGGGSANGFQPTVNAGLAVVSCKPVAALSVQPTNKNEFYNQTCIADPAGSHWPHRIRSDTN